MDLSEKKIALIIPDFNFGGEEHRVTYFANNYLLYFKEVYLISPEGFSLRNLDIRVKHYNINVRNPFNIFKVLIFLNRNEVNYLQGHKRATLPYLFLAEKLLNTVSLFNFDNIYLKFNRICALITPHHIAYLSDILKEFYMPYYKNSKYNNVTINMGGNFFKKQPQEQINDFKGKLGIDNKFVLLSLGRLDNQKNHQLLLHALSLVKNENFVCLIVGDGILKTDLLLLTTQLNLNDKIKFLGQRNDIENILNASDVLVQSSIFEGFPNVFIEAASVAVPIIATRVGSSETLVRDNGILVKSNDKLGLSSSIEEIISNYELYKQNAVFLSNSEFIKQFKREEMLKNYLRFFDKYFVL
jgi:glycosyltransferase involved in cell wall biosynthesis